LAGGEWVSPPFAGRRAPRDGRSRHNREVIWFLRHGDAEDGADDFARGLTQKGEQQSRDAGKALAALGVSLDACLTSPLVRARQTADLASETLGIKPEEASELSGGEFDPLALAAGRGDVLLVGHEPDFSRAVGDLTGARVEMKKGGLAGVDGPTLVTLLRPEQIKRIAG
jgi:phosphohistidine phosphatase